MLDMSNTYQKLRFLITKSIIRSNVAFQNSICRVVGLPLHNRNKYHITPVNSA